jgi:RimJ/RimL family protein N-acetyltransferase
MMRLERYRLASDFLDELRAFLEEKEAENNLLLGFLEVFVEDRGDSSKLYMAKIANDENSCRGAALYTQRNLVLSVGLDVSGLELVADSLEREGLSIPGVVGPSMISQAFARRWAQRSGKRCSLAMDQRIYRFDRGISITDRVGATVMPLHTKLAKPAAVEGEMRPMQPEDEDLVADWIFNFTLEATPATPYTREQSQNNARERVQAGGTFLWIADDRAVSMAALARPTRHGICVNAVYTPQHLRRRGYASLLVATLTEYALNERGKDFCVLYTDLQNPTSNAIYQRIGYRAILDSQNYRFA